MASNCRAVMVTSMNTNNLTFELNDAVRDDAIPRDEKSFRRNIEICSALFNGADVSRFGRETDAVVSALRDSAARADAGDGRARSEINTIVRFIVQPRLIEALKVFGYLGNYHELRLDQTPVVKAYSYKGLAAREQAAGGDVTFAKRDWKTYPIATRTISGGMVIDYRELAAGNFDGSVAEEAMRLRADITNKALAYVLTVLKSALSSASGGVKFYSEYTGALTKTAVDSMLAKLRRIGKVGIAGDFAALSAICDFTGYRTVGDITVPYASPSMIEELARTGLNGFYKGASLVELPNPYNFEKPLADNSAFETLADVDTLYFLIQGAPSPLNIFRRGDITTLTGNDVETGMVKTRFDLEIGADVVKGREYEIGMLCKA